MDNMITNTDCVVGWKCFRALLSNFNMYMNYLGELVKMQILTTSQEGLDSLHI